MSQNEPLVVPNDTEANHCSSKNLKIINALAYVINFAITYGIGVGGLLNLPTNAEQSTKYQTLVTPAGWAFSIWGIIFSAQAIWSIAPIFYHFEATASATIESVGYKYLYICLLQAAWTFSFAFDQIALSAALMTALCVALWYAVCSILGTSNNSTANVNYFLFVFPFTIHAGWITAATAVNLNVAAVAWHATTMIQFVAAVLSLLVVLIVGVRVIKIDKTIPIVIAWACIGIYFELLGKKMNDKFSEDQIQAVMTEAAVTACVVLALVFQKHLY